MQRTSFDEMACSIARTLDVAGEWWTPLIVRDVYLGVTRFDALQRNLGVSRKVLAARLAGLVDRGVLERRAYQERPVRHDYELTAKGKELAVVLMALMAWGDRWTAGDAGPPMVLTHASCGHDTTPTVSCSSCGEPLDADHVVPRGGPGARIGPGTAEIAAALARR
jgi:DNA-binding HxlR family transcriptional regulator